METGPGGWRERARRLREEALALALACRDPRTPRLARVLAALVAAYAASPIDLIPDFIPVLGLLDDLLIVPLGVALVIRMLPPLVLEESRARARSLLDGRVAGARLAAAAIIALWLLLAAASAFAAWRLLSGPRSNRV